PSRSCGNPLGVVAGLVDRGDQRSVVEHVAPHGDELRLQVDVDGRDARDAPELARHGRLAMVAVHAGHGVGLRLHGRQYTPIGYLVQRRPLGSMDVEELLLAWFGRCGRDLPWRRT